MGSVHCGCPAFEEGLEVVLDGCTNCQRVDDDAEFLEKDGNVSLHIKGRKEALGRPLWLLVASMNAGDAEIKLQSDAWIPRKGRLKSGEGIFDIIAVGVQEAVLGAQVTLPRSDASSPRHCNELLAEFLGHLGKDYNVICALSRGAMSLMLFASRFGPPIDRIETAAENTGLAHVWPNKGGLLAKLEVGGASLCFISAHLAAKTGKVQRRNQDVAEILWGTKVSGMDLDAPSYCHHSFFFGDLNYRLDLPQDVEQEEAWEVDNVLSQIEAKDFRGLLEHDQLHAEMEAGHVLQGFTAAWPSWAPTYRVLRRAGNFFDRERVPSYCDRVLHRSLPGCQGALLLQSFTSAPEVPTSDHKPIVSSWHLGYVAARVS
ncbi:unnamed protein product [Effrenium voratum]|uniref:Inositol polyphosphate-related phosphatase domain-containing protein n=1 Tax=Effrenium voratum TaxID=2562239 RepID=A0AA36HN92_9DINO|nr:unnamed protein product [Effrenium voratum]